MMLDVRYPTHSEMDREASLWLGTSRSEMTVSGLQFYATPMAHGWHLVVRLRRYGVEYLKAVRLTNRLALEGPNPKEELHKDIGWAIEHAFDALTLGQLVRAVT